MMGNNKSHFLILILQLNCWTLSKKLDDYPPHKLSQASLWRTCSMNGQKAFARVTGRLVKCVSALETAKLTSKLVQNPFFNHTNHYSRCQQCPSFVTCSAEKTDTLQKNLQLTHWSNVRVTFILLSPACQSVFISLLSVCHQKILPLLDGLGDIFAAG